MVMMQLPAATDSIPTSALRSHMTVGGRGDVGLRARTSRAFWGKNNLALPWGKREGKKKKGILAETLLKREVGVETLKVPVCTGRQLSSHCCFLLIMVIYSVKHIVYSGVERTDARGHGAETGFGPLIFFRCSLSLLPIG